MTQLLKIQRERLYGGPIGSGPRFHYVAYLRGSQVATGETKEEAETRATDRIMGALECQQSGLLASQAVDGTICTTREYAPGEVEFTYHRGLDRFSGSMMSRLEIDGRRVTVKEFHQHYVEMYNDATRPVAS